MQAYVSDLLRSRGELRCKQARTLCKAFFIADSTFVPALAPRNQSWLFT